MKYVFYILLFLFVSGPSVLAKVQGIDFAPSFSIYNQPKYSKNFHNFSYVNPHAPKGGKLTLPAYGGFDNFNPFIFKLGEENHF